MVTKELRRRPLGDPQALPDSIPLWLRKIYVQRGILEAVEIELSTKQLYDYRLLSGIDNAVNLLEKTIIMQRKVVIVGDFDADGATSTALMVLALQAMGLQQVDFLVPNRFDDGYGLTVGIVQQAHLKNAQLIITVDNGISSYEGVKYAKSVGIQVIITDHHLPGEQLPIADAIVNPNLPGCPFPSKMLAGVGVAFYLMVALRAHLRQTGFFVAKRISEPNLAEWLDLVALGTIADIVPLDSNNRILVQQGLNRIRGGQCRPGIYALAEVAHRSLPNLSTSDLGFAFAPRINAAGRLEDMSLGIQLLLATDLNAARTIAIELDQLNQTRREIEQGMQLEARQICAKIQRQQNAIPAGIALYHHEWHQGIVGLLAARIKEQFHRPVVAFAPAGEGLLKGSGRSIQGLHLRDLLERLAACYPELMISFGGHAMAAGLVIQERCFDQFREQFAEFAEQWIDDTQLEGIIWSDGELAAELLTLETAETIRRVSPWGQGFPEPVFDGHFRLLQQRLVGNKHLKVLLEPIAGGCLIEGIAFNIDLTIWPDQSVHQVVIAYRPQVNEFKGTKSVQCIIEYMWPCS